MKDGSIIDHAPTLFSAEQRRSYPYLGSIDSQEMTYASDGLRVKGFVARPVSGGPYPCVIYNRGGNREFAAITTDTVARLLCRIASWGYFVAASQYRGNAGGEGREQFGGDDVNDVMNLFPLLEMQPAADTRRIGMYGGSRGGMMTYLALTRTERIQAAVIRCGVADLTGWTEDRSDMQQVYEELIPGFSPGDESALKRRSAVYWAEKLCKTTPILLMQGTADWRVNPLSALRMAEALLKTRHPYRLVMFEGSDHTLNEHAEERDQLTRDWFDRFVRNRESLPNLEPHGD